MPRLIVDLPRYTRGRCPLCQCPSDQLGYPIQLEGGFPSFRCQQHLAEMLGPPRKDLIELTADQLEVLIYRKLGWPR